MRTFEAFTKTLGKSGGQKIFDRKKEAVETFLKIPIKQYRLLVHFDTNLFRSIYTYTAFLFNLKQNIMKKLFLIVAILFSTLSIAQENNTSFYLATGLSIANSDNFEQSSYVSAELGLMVDNLAFGAVLGRNNLENAFGENESFENYWYEAKIAAYQPLGSVDGYLLVGVGSYVENGNIFLEYGAGISKEFNNIALFIQVSNWDGVTYVTPGISFSL